MLFRSILSAWLPNFSKGFQTTNDSVKKHTHIYGVTDDGMIEKGVGHVHPAFTDVKPKGVDRIAALLSENMLELAGDRQNNYQLWGIGKPFQNIAAKSVGFTPALPSAAFPPFGGNPEVRKIWGFGASSLSEFCSLGHRL